MRLLVVLLVSALLSPSLQAPPDISGAWAVTVVDFGVPNMMPRAHRFDPTNFELYFTSRVEPVLRIAPGDTVTTWSVGADGVDAKGERRSPGGNPQTGPFHVEGAMPGDTLVVRLNRLRTNRAWAVSGSRVMSTAVEPGHLAGRCPRDLDGHRVYRGPYRGPEFRPSIIRER